MSQSIGSAGQRGDKIRSDVFVEVEITSDRGVEIDLKSKVELYYGKAIRTQTKDVLDRLGISNARVLIEDKGALPYVLEGRIESAARAAGATAPEGVNIEPGEPSGFKRLRRSRLYLPGNEPKYMTNAGLHAPDAVILDLEDSVHPAAKDSARYLVKSALLNLDFKKSEKMVRINQGELGFVDLDTVIPALPDLILIPKVERAEEVVAVDERIQAILKDKGIKREIWLMPIIESALGVENAFAIASSSERVVALTIGLEDFTADLGVLKTVDGAETAWARARILNAAVAAGVQAIDSVYGDVGDVDGLQAWAERARSMGYTGMGCVHPRQIPVIHKAMAPAQIEIDKAVRIVAAFADAKAKGLAVVSLGSKMIDPPVVERAARLLNEAHAMGLIEKVDENEDSV
ncbi:citrate lyase ACP [Myxococcota bacterium]|nr:citrate lyase ACP [Myxococcota bacterium]